MTDTVLEGDGLALLRSLPGRSVTAVITDPPWNRAQDYGPADDELPPDTYRRWLAAVVAECCRVASDAAVLLVGDEHADGVVPGPTECSGTLRWLPPPRTVRPPATLDLSHATVVWFRHDPADVVPPAVLDVALEPDPYLHRHPCPKPVSLFAALIERCVDARGPVLDPFCGTGSCLVAASRAGRPAFGIDIDARSCAIARERLRAER